MPRILRVVLEERSMETPRYAFSDLHFRKFPDSDDFQRWRASIKTETTIPELTMSWINEVEMAGSIDDLMTS